jgi:ABC-type Fe3+/spermidine/putrescine transport system ATPase subunit
MLKIEGLKKQYGSISALREVTVEAAPGEVLAVIGPSGCGKTTLLRLVAGFERPDAGTVSIDGVLVSSGTHLAAPASRGVSMIFQDLALWPHMTVEKHIRFVLKKHKQTHAHDIIKAEINRVLKDVNLEDCLHRRPHELSGGEKQRLAIARAIAAKPMYLLMDEPFSNLDSILKSQLQDLVIRLKSNFNMGVVYVTHAVEEALALADRIAIMKEGEIIQADQKEAVLKHPINEFAGRLLGPGR